MLTYVQIESSWVHLADAPTEPGYQTPKEPVAMNAEQMERLIKAIEAMTTNQQQLVEAVKDLRQAVGTVGCVIEDYAGTH